MTALGHPFAWHWHVLWPLALVTLYASYVWATRIGDRRASGRQRLLFSLGALALLVAFTWPLDDLATHWSLLFLVLQRLLLMLAAPPLLVGGMPKALIVRLTHPAAVDAALRVVVKPVTAICIVTAVAVGTLTTGAVSVAAHSEVARGFIQIAVLVSGFVLWAPVLTVLPGSRHLSAIGRGAYLIVQSIVPSFLSVVWIFARRPLYASYAHHGRVLGMSPVLDQQLAGFLAKLSTIAVLWTVAFTIMTRGQPTSGTDDEGAPLMWSDVQREIERAERRDRRRHWIPQTRRAEPPN